MYNKNRIIIFGNGDLASELMSFARFDISKTSLISKLDESNLDYSKIDKSSKIYLAYSDPKLKLKILNNLKENNLVVSSFVHETVLIGLNVHLGKGVIIFP